MQANILLDFATLLAIQCVGKNVIQRHEICISEFRKCCTCHEICALGSTKCRPFHKICTSGLTKCCPCHEIYSSLETPDPERDS